ncbi:phage holin family protein [Candidatus Saccharibacteria bacterium]|nr:MAG: phage holin family protein [Candidatus Saccharibacteria bacterium]
MFRVVINILIKATVIFGLNTWGWVHFRFNGAELTTPGGYILYALGFGLIFALVGAVVRLVMGFLTAGIGLVTAGIGALLLLPVLMFGLNALTLWIFSGWLPSWVTLAGFWPTVGAGLLLGLMIPATKQGSSSSRY